MAFIQSLLNPESSRRNDLRLSVETEGAEQISSSASVDEVSPTSSEEIDELYDDTDEGEEEVDDQPEEEDEEENTAPVPTPARPIGEHFINSTPELGMVRRADWEMARQHEILRANDAKILASTSSQPGRAPRRKLEKHDRKIDLGLHDHKPHADCPDTLACLPDTNGRPQHTLPVILRCAILGSPRKRLTIREIYATMEAKYPFYKAAGQTWKQSVRHHLSLNRLFEREPRPVTDPGFGSYWVVNLEAPPGTKRPRKRGRPKEEEDVDASVAATKKPALTKVMPASVPEPPLGQVLPPTKFSFQARPQPAQPQPHTQTMSSTQPPSPQLPQPSTLPAQSRPQSEAQGQPQRQSQSKSQTQLQSQPYSHQSQPLSQHRQHRHPVSPHSHRQTHSSQQFSPQYSPHSHQHHPQHSPPHQQYHQSHHYQQSQHQSPPRHHTQSSQPHVHPPTHPQLSHQSNHESRGLLSSSAQPIQYKFHQHIPKNAQTQEQAQPVRQPQPQQPPPTRQRSPKPVTPPPSGREATYPPSSETEDNTGNSPGSENEPMVSEDDDKDDDSDGDTRNARRKSGSQFVPTDPANIFSLPATSSIDQNRGIIEHMRQEIATLRRTSAEAVSTSIRLSEQLASANLEVSRSREAVRDLEDMLQDETTRRREAERSKEMEAERRRVAEQVLGSLQVNVVMRSPPGQPRPT